MIWNAHVREMTDLPAVDRYYLRTPCCKWEAAAGCEVLRPDKINLASLGQCRAASALACDPALCWTTATSRRRSGPRRSAKRPPRTPGPIWRDCLRERLATLHQHP